MNTKGTALTSLVRSMMTKSSALRKLNWCSSTHFRAMRSYMNLMARHLHNAILSSLSIYQRR